MGGTLGHHFDIINVNFKKQRKRKQKENEELKSCLEKFRSIWSMRMKAWGTKGKKLVRRKSMVMFREQKKKIRAQRITQRLMI